MQFSPILQHFYKLIPHRLEFLTFQERFFYLLLLIIERFVLFLQLVSIKLKNGNGNREDDRHRSYSQAEDGFEG
jgi:hypothetical protein